MKTFANIISFYWDGFRSMRTGRILWLIIIIKLTIIFGCLKVIFFPDILHSRFDSDTERADHVFTNLTQLPKKKQ